MYHSKTLQELITTPQSHNATAGREEVAAHCDKMQLQPTAELQTEDECGGGVGQAYKKVDSGRRLTLSSQLPPERRTV